MHEETAELAGQALAAGALESLSGARAGAELRLALEEEDPLSALAELQRTGVLGALHPRLRVDARLTQKALELAGPQESRVVVLLASLTLALAVRADGAGRAEVAAFLDRLEFQAPDRDRAASAAAGAARLLDALEGARADAEIHDACAWALPEGVALAGALAPEGSQARRAAERWLQAVRHVRLDITGDDLLAAGVGAGPEVGERLRAALRARLEGTIGEGREEELRAALAAPAGERRVEGSR
jgi:tRNA nucleotidyltransferase/poly(A) polymerase